MHWVGMYRSRRVRQSVTYWGGKHRSRLARLHVLYWSRNHESHRPHSTIMHWVGIHQSHMAIRRMSIHLIITNSCFPWPIGIQPRNEWRQTGLQNEYELTEILYVSPKLPPHRGVGIVKEQMFTRASDQAHYNAIQIWTHRYIVNLCIYLYAGSQCIVTGVTPPIHNKRGLHPLMTQPFDSLLVHPGGESPLLNICLIPRSQDDYNQTVLQKTVSAMDFCALSTKTLMRRTIFHAPRVGLYLLYSYLSGLSSTSPST